MDRTVQLKGKDWPNGLVKKSQLYSMRDIL
jgi:hypothetical protein